MSTGAIIGLIVLAVIVVAAFMLMMRFSKDRQRKREIDRRNRAIEERREEVVSQERSLADERASRAERAEQMARMERAAAEQHKARADLHREGHLDDELAHDVDPDGTADVREDSQTGSRDVRSERDATIGTPETEPGAGTELEHGRRFERERLTTEEEQERLRNR